jgi:hypothetical protein
MNRLLSSVSMAVVACIAALGLTISTTTAQDATPAATPVAGFSGFPQVNVTVTDSEIDVFDAQIPAGYVVLMVTNNSSDSTGVGILGPAPGETMDQLEQEAATPPAAGTNFPPFFYKATIAGGPGNIPPGETRQAVVNVPAGDWVLISEGDQPPTPVTAVETADSVTTPPTADVQITESDFLFSGFDTDQAGSQDWEVTNTGQQPHMLVFAKVPDGTTVDDIKKVASEPDNATPAPGEMQESDFMFPGGDVILQSSGQTVYASMDITEGTYTAICFVTDPATGQPHAMEGMISVFHEGGSATPAS